MDALKSVVRQVDADVPVVDLIGKGMPKSLEIYRDIIDKGTTMLTWKSKFFF